MARAIAAGVNYFDTAVQYGDGESEKNLGRVLRKLKPAGAVVGTKVRLPPGGSAASPTPSRIARRQSDAIAPRAGRHPSPAQRDHHGGGGAERRRGARRSGAGVRAAAPHGKLRFLGMTGGRRHGRAPSGDRCRRLRQRADRLQHAQSVRGRRIAGELSGPGLRPAVRSHRGGRRASSPSACSPAARCPARPSVTRSRARRPSRSVRP